MHKKHMKKRATTVAFLSFALSAVAAVRTLPTPPESAFADAESSVSMQFSQDDEERRVRLTLSGNFTPSNCVQVALGQDMNADGDLAPGETWFVFCVDCGVPFVREEFRRGRGQSPASQFGLVDNPLGGQGLTAAPGASTYTFAFKQPSAVTDRLTHAKVTTHNLADTNVIVAVEFYNRGQVLFLR